MDRNPKVSIIVPVYNAEKTLKRCLDSITAQTLKNFECILVDDGSKDDSGRMCDEYSAKDKRFVTIHQKNQGVSSARQTGLDHAKGIYIIHADPDDWVDESWIESLFKKTTDDNVDVLFTDFIREYEDRSIISHQNIKDSTCHEAINLILEGQLFATSWVYLVRRSCIIENSIHFKKGMSLWEDQYFLLSLLLCNIKVGYLHKAFYHYDLYTNSSSIVRKHSISQVRSQMTLISDLGPILEKKGYNTYFLKYSVKQRLFQTRIVANGIIKNTYPEINTELIRKISFKNWYKEEFNVFLCVKGHESAAIKILPFQEFYSKLLYKYNKIKHLCRKLVS